MYYYLNQLLYSTKQGQVRNAREFLKKGSLRVLRSLQLSSKYVRKLVEQDFFSKLLHCRENVIYQLFTKWGQIMYY